MSSSIESPPVEAISFRKDRVSKRPRFERDIKAAIVFIEKSMSMIEACLMLIRCPFDVRRDFAVPAGKP